MKLTTRICAFVVALLLAVPLIAQEPTPSERLLLPILTPPVHGAFGSEFHTDLRIHNDSDDVVFLLGMPAGCTFICLPSLFPLVLDPHQEIGPDDIALNGTPGRFIFVAKDQVSLLSMNLRVHDVTRGGQNFGTEIPIVRESEFRTDRIVFVGVPTDARFRNTLRIYGESPVDVLVTVGNQAPVRVKLAGGFSFPTASIAFPEFFTPSYAAFSSFPTGSPIGSAPVRVTVEADPGFIIISLLPFETKLWAFITVTNNDTQAITTITPQP